MENGYFFIKKNLNKYFYESQILFDIKILP